MMSENQYFAAVPKDEIGKRVWRRIEDYFDTISKGEHWDKIMQCYNAYYGLDKGASRESGTSIGRKGEEGELLHITVNQFRSLLRNVLILATANRSAFQPMATNTDHKSQSQCIVASGVLDYYMQHRGVETILNEAAEYALALTEGFVCGDWDESLGEDVQPDPNDENNTIKEGDIKLRAKGPFQVIRDLAKDNDTHQWYIVQDFENKYDLAAQYSGYSPEQEPEKSEGMTDVDFAEVMRQYQSQEEQRKAKAKELYDKIVNFQPKNLQFKGMLSCDMTKGEVDHIPVYRLYHEKTKSVRDGRLTILLAEDLVLFDGPSPFRKIPVFRITHGKVLQSALGYSTAFDLLPIQEAVDLLYSTALTNLEKFGVGGVIADKGAQVDYRQLAGGPRLFEVNDGKTVQPYNFTQIPDEVQKYIQAFEGVGMVLSGINNVVRGNPEGKVMSGAAMALLAAQAVLYNSDFQKSYNDLASNVATLIIHFLQDFPTTARMVAITGKSNQSYLKEFTSDDIADISRVLVEMVSSMSKTPAGRLQIADQILEKGMVSTPQEYLTIINTGKAEPLLEADTKQLLLIRSENERLKEGKPVIALITDKHDLHIPEHEAVLADHISRMDPGLRQATLDHILEHETLKIQKAQRDAAIAASLQVAGQGVGQAMPSMPATGDGQAEAAMAVDSGQGPSMPSMPKNPLTGENYQLPGGEVPQAQPIG